MVREILEAIRICRDQQEALISKKHERSSSVTATLPPSLARRDVDTGEMASVD
tara:strand:- start:3459 stop:3617 length:159 start_codon:yes stop_codon:yes gene_type:complete